MKHFFLFVGLTASIITCAQKSIDNIDAKEAERIERILAADDMEGRQAGKRGSDRAAEFIAAEFKKAGLQTFKNSSSYLQPFKLLETKLVEIKGEFDDKKFDSSKIFMLTTKQNLEIDEKSGFEIKTIAAGANMMQAAYNIINEEKKAIVFVDESFFKYFFTS